MACLADHIVAVFRSQLNQWMVFNVRVQCLPKRLGFDFLNGILLVDFVDLLNAWKNAETLHECWQIRLTLYFLVVLHRREVVIAHFCNVLFHFFVIT